MYVYIRAMSEAQAEVYRKITDATPKIVEHFVKLTLYPNSRDCNHWKQEIYNFLNSVPKLRNNNKWPKAKLIIKALSIYNDSIDNFIERATEDYGSQQSSLTLNEIESWLKDYENWLADKLSEKGFVRSVDVYAKLDEMLNKIR